MYLNFAIIALILLTYSLVAGKVERGPISAPMVFLIIGLLLGPFSLHILDVKLEVENYKLLAELALALVLFTDASKTNLKVLRHNITIPSRLLLIGLPITIIAGTLIGKLVFPDFLWVELAILATVLAPTDAALGEPVVSNKSVPTKIREAINVESGLNDGICVPILLLLLAFQKVQVNEQISWQYGIMVFAKQIGIGLATGISIVSLSVLLIKKGISNKWIEASWKPTLIITLSIACFSMAQALGGSGFIAAFTGGVVLDRSFKNKKLDFLDGAEGVGKILSSTVWIIFGSVLTVWIYKYFTLPILLYAVASLTVIRIIPVFISLLTQRLHPYEKFFMAWFGPRGLASIVFAILVLEADLQSGNTIVVTACLTILLSVFAHGITAIPMAKAFKKPQFFR